MQIHDLRPAECSSHRRKVVGRGPGSGHGKTSTRGHKGDKARGSTKPNFEGGQTKLYRQIPQLRGFKAVNKTVWAIVNVGDLERFDAGTEVTPEFLIANGFARDLKDVLVTSEEGSSSLDARAMRQRNMGGLKVLGNGELTKKLTVRAHKFSKSAVEKLQAAGGVAETL